MKSFWKTFILSIIFFISAIYLGSHSYTKIYREESLNNMNIIKENKSSEKVNSREENKKEVIKKEESYSSLEESFKNSKRINALIVGLEDIRTDTIILASFHPEDKNIDFISIPRDTYIHRRGYNQGEQRKINAIYGSHGISGVKKAVSYTLGDVPIHHHIIMDYRGVESIVDSLGGIEVVVPFHMVYKDPTATPPLYINIPEGKQILDGKQSLNFLRYRKGNKGKSGYIDGDLGRIKSQQEFLKSFIDKTLSHKLPIVVKKGFEHIETDIKLLDGINYATKVIGIKTDDFKFQILPGESEYKRINGKLLSYYIPNSLETKNLLETLYKVKKPPKN
ncbi:MAG: LytR family transcriptional regulator [Tissierellia bacterium]|nr:LytR family transcriptional regulator [Tissierellia bacterium]